MVTAIIVFMGALVIIAVVASLKHGTENRKINKDHRAGKGILIRAAVIGGMGAGGTKNSSLLGRNFFFI